MSAVPFPRRILGDTFKQLRHKHGWSKNRASLELGISRDKLNSIEDGNTRLTIMDIRGLCSTYGVEQELEHELIALADTRQKDGWLEQYGEGIPRYAQKFVNLEQRAKEILIYEPEFVTGLFQTQEYIRANHARDHLLDPVWSQKVLAARLERQTILKQDGEHAIMRMIFNEPVLTRAIGGQEVMDEQISYLREVNQLPFVTISVLRLSVGSHPSMTGAYTILAFDETEQDVVYMESRDGCRYVSDATTLALYRRDFNETEALAVPLEEFVE